MKKYATLEIWVDDSIEDYEKCVKEVIDNCKSHEYCCDETVSIKILEKEGVR